MVRHSAPVFLLLLSQKDTNGRGRPECEYFENEVICIAEFASKGVAGAGLGTGIAGLTLGVLNGGLGNLFNGGLMNGCAARSCSEDHCVNRYEMGLAQENAALKSDIALRDANVYQDQKMLEMYKYIDGKLNEVHAVLSSQAVMNQSTKDSFQLLQERMDCCKNELCGAISRERDERRCADNTIVTYTNATFYPKMVADVTVGTTTTAQTVYNPLPVASCGCGGGCGC